MPVSSRTDLRARITETAAAMLREQGPAAVTTRGVAEAAGVQAPTIYRLFGDKDGLLEAVAEHAMAAQVAEKARTDAAAEQAGLDPVDELRRGWRSQIAFGLANPAVFRLLSDPDRVRGSAAARAGRDVLVGRVHRAALGGRLRVEEGLAADLLQSAGIGVIQTLLSQPPDRRDPDLPEAALEAVLAQVLVPVAGGARHDPVVAAAVTLRAAAPGLAGLTGAERLLLAEWADRVVDGAGTDS